MASVYVFNATNGNISLILDGMQAGNLQAMSQSDGYALQPLPVPYTATPDPESPQFGSQTQMVLQDENGVQNYQVRIGGGNQPPNQDYQLFIFSRSAALVWQGGAEMLTPAQGPNMG